jgi:hypothetical protein
MMPDLAYDPRSSTNGPIHFVFTEYHTPLIAYIHTQSFKRDPYAPRYPDETLPINSVCQLTGQIISQEHNGFHPRIDVGEIDFGGEGWKVGVAFTGVNYLDQDKFQVRLSYGNATNWPTSFNDIPIQGDVAAGAMPTIDIGTPGTNNGAIAWTQTRSGSWNDVTAVVADYHGGYRFLDPAVQGQSVACSASPSVAVWDAGTPDTYATAVAFLQTINPNSVPWNPAAVAAVVEEDDPNPIIEFRDRWMISDTLHGDFDSGSQYTDWYGMSTSLSADAGGWYWMLYSSFDGAGDHWGMRVVRGTYGFSQI